MTTQDLTSLEFYAPIFLLLALCTAMPSREQEADILLERHIRQFAALYIRNQQPCHG